MCTPDSDSAIPRRPRVVTPTMPLEQYVTLAGHSRNQARVSCPSRLMPAEPEEDDEQPHARAHRFSWCGRKHGYQGPRGRLLRGDLRGPRERGGGVHTIPL